MWQRFTEDARRVVFAAQAAMRLGCAQVSDAHLLLGILEDPECAGFRVLVALGVDPERVRGEVERRLDDGEPRAASDLTLSPRGERIIDLAFDESQRLGNGFIGTEHLVLGLIREREGTAGTVLAELGARLDDARRAVEALQIEAGTRPRIGEASRPPQDSTTEETKDMWQRFTERARKVVFYAQEEAQKFGEGYVSTEHLLLGLVRESDSVAARVLERLGVSLNRVRVEVEKQLPRGDARPSQDMTLTPRAKRVIDLAYDEARNLNNNYIGTEHLLLGLIREGDGLAGRVLAKLGVELERARREVMALQDTEAGRPSTPEAPARTFAWSEFDDSAQATLLGAEAERERAADAQVSPLHLLLALIEQEDSAALRALERLGVGLDVIRMEIEGYRVWAPGAPDIRLSPNARKAVDASHLEASRLGDDHLGSEHLLLGLVRGNDRGVGSLLGNLGVTYPMIRDAILEGRRVPEPPAEEPPEDEGGSASA